MTTKAQKTPFQLEKEKRDEAIYREFQELMSEPGAMATAVEAHLMKRHSIHSRATIHNIRTRVSNREKALKEPAQ